MHGILEKKYTHLFFAMLSFSDLHLQMFSKQLEYYEQHVPESRIASIKDEFLTTYNKIHTICEKHFEIMALWNNCLIKIQQMWSSPPHATETEICCYNFENFNVTWTDLKTDMYKECLDYMEQCVFMDFVYDVASIANLCCGCGHGQSHEEVNRSIGNACVRIFKRIHCVPPPPPLQDVDAPKTDADNSYNSSSNISPGKGKRKRSIDAPLEGVGKFVRWCSSKPNIGILKVIGQSCDEIYFDKALCPAKHIYVGWEMQYTREQSSQFAKTLTFPNHES